MLLDLFSCSDLAGLRKLYHFIVIDFLAYSVEFYVHVAESLLALAASLPKSTVAKAGGTVAATGTVSTLDALIDETLAAAVAEHADSDDAWIARYGNQGKGYDMRKLSIRYFEKNMRVSSFMGISLECYCQRWLLPSNGKNE